MLLGAIRPGAVNISFVTQKLSFGSDPVLLRVFDSPSSFI